MELGEFDMLPFSEIQDKSLFSHEDFVFYGMLYPQPGETKYICISMVWRRLIEADIYIVL